MTQNIPLDPAWLTWVETLSDPHSLLEVVLCAFSDCDPDYLISSRRLPDHLIYQVVENGIQATFAKSDRVVERGQLLWVPPQVEHSFRPAVAGTRVRLYHFRFVLPPGCPPGPPVVLPDAPHRQAHLTALYDNGAGDLALWRLRCRASLAMVFCDIAETLGRQGHHTSPALTPEQRQEIMQAVAADLWCEPKRLAALLEYHPVYFTRLFKRSFGLAPRSWILHQRMGRAASLLLDSTAQVSELAVRLGYADAFVFSRQFKQVHGVSPRVWRQQHASPPADDRSPRLPL